VDRTPVLTDYGQYCEALSHLINGEHDYRTCITDSVDWLERLIHHDVARAHKKQSIEEIPYGKGYALALEHWDFVLNSWDELRRRRGMAIILIAHTRITKYSDPMTDSYDRYEPDLHKSISPRLQEWCDEVLFGNYRVSTFKRDEGFGRSRTRAAGDGERIVYTCEQPTHLAKRRCQLPDEMPLDFSVYIEHLKKATSNGGNIAGMVVNGSSKTEENGNG
jgi:hypothetical protein